MIKRLTLFVTVGMLSLAVYLSTLAPTITWRNEGVDSGDLATAVAVGGIPHPPGYPTYLLLGEIFKLLPFGDVAYRLNLLSAFCAALAVAIVGLVIYRMLSTAIRQEKIPQVQGLAWLSAASASLTLAFSGTFWSQAVIAEVYAPHVFFATLLLYGALQVRPANAGWLVPVLFGLLGVSLGNHFSILFLFPMLIWVLKARWRWRLIVATLLAFCCGLLVFVLLPFRAAAFPPVNWGMATTWPNFLWLVSAEPYRQYLFAAPWEIVPVRIGAELYLLAKDFMGWGIPVGLLGWLRLIQVNPSMAYSGLLTYFLFSIYAIGYNTTDSYIYLLPAFFIFTLWLGWGLYDISTVLQKLPLAKFYRASLIGGGFIFLPLLSLLLNFSGQNIRGDEEAYTYAQQSLQQVAPGAIIVTDSDRHTFTLWYSRYGLALRSDVAIVNSNLLIYAWYRQTLRQTHPHLRLLDQAGRPLTTCSAFMEQNISHSPIYLTSPQCPTPAGYRLEPGSPLQRVVRLNSG